jgi:hypothetical protein
MDETISGQPSAWAAPEKYSAVITDSTGIKKELYAPFLCSYN